MVCMKWVKLKNNTGNNGMCKGSEVEKQYQQQWYVKQMMLRNNTRHSGMYEAREMGLLPTGPKHSQLWRSNPPSEVLTTSPFA